MSFFYSRFSSVKTIAAALTICLAFAAGPAAADGPPGKVIYEAREIFAIDGEPGDVLYAILNAAGSEKIAVYFQGSQTAGIYSREGTPEKKQRIISIRNPLRKPDIRDITTSRSGDIYLIDISNYNLSRLSHDLKITASHHCGGPHPFYYSGQDAMIGTGSRNDIRLFDPQRGITAVYSGEGFEFSGVSDGCALSSAAPAANAGEFKASFDGASAEVEIETEKRFEYRKFCKIGYPGKVSDARIIGRDEKSHLYLWVKAIKFDEIKDYITEIDAAGKIISSVAADFGEAAKPYKLVLSRSGGILFIVRDAQRHSVREYIKKVVYSE